MIDLARCDDFALGPATVRPSSHELVTATATITLEPKVMQVLVALVRAGGRVVSRDDLIEQCWRGRVVGDDAINRVLGKARRATDAIGPAVRIETIARTGYRLVVAVPDDAPVVSSAAPPVPPVRALAARRPRWRLAAIGTAVAVVVVVAATQPHRAAAPLPPATALPQAVSDLETRGLSAMFENTPAQTAEAIGYLRQATLLAPRSAPVWGSLAMSYVLGLGWTPPGERAAGASRVRDAAAHGLALDPRESRSTAALVSLAPTTGHWAAKAAALAAATRAAHPDVGPLAYQRVQFALATGHSEAALAEVERLAHASPLIPWIQAARIDLLAAAGRLDEADRVAEQMRAIWPHERLMWFTRFDVAAFNGQPGRAAAMAADRAGWPQQTAPAEIDRAARTAAALQRRDAGNTAALLATLAAAVHGTGDAERLMRAAAALGRPAIALAAARRLVDGTLPAQPRGTMLPLIGLPDDADPPTAALFVPPAAALWADPGFMPLMTATGLTAYWRRSGAPDLCASPAARASCVAAGLTRPAGVSVRVPSDR